MIGKSLVIAGALIVAPGIANAATTLWTEGNGNNRALVAGSIDLEDASPGGGGFALGSLSAGDTFGIYGRIVSSVDRFSFDFSTNGIFDVSFDFDGYDLDGGGSVAAGLSGLVDQAAVLNGTVPATGGGKGVTISLLKDGMAFLSESYTTNVVLGAVATIFDNVGPGDYTLVVDGSSGPASGRAALYDLEITAVPIPAALPLLAGGLGILGLAGWRRRKAA